MTPETAIAIRDRIAEATQEIRVLCPPRGHFIAVIALCVPEGTGMLVMRPRGPGKRYVGNVHAGHHGFRMDTYGCAVCHNGAPPTGSFNVALRCTKQRCGYHGSFAYLPLSFELAALALAGHAEYRLTR